MTDSLQGVSVVMPVLIRHEWQRIMTQCAIDTLRCTTELPFELVIPQAHRTRNQIYEWRNANKVIECRESGNCNADFNEGADAASGDLLVYTGNDVFTRPGWLEALLACFDIKDCGVATLASADLSHRPDWARLAASGKIVEGIYGPFMMFGRQWRFDAVRFPQDFGDTDMITRIYRSGKRAYRNWSCVIQHLNRQTIGEDSALHQRQFEAGHKLYMRRHEDCGLLMYRALSEGWPI